jgi:hypothetical protein
MIQNRTDLTLWYLQGYVSKLFYLFKFGPNFFHRDRKRAKGQAGRQEGMKAKVQKSRRAGRQTVVHTDICTNIHTDRETETDRQTGRHVDIQSVRQTDRLRD